MNRPRRLCVWGLTTAWLVNALILFAVVLWTYFDGRSLLPLTMLQSKLGFNPHRVEWPEISAQTTATVVASAIIVATLVAFTLFKILLGLFIGPQRFRTMRGWLLFMALACGWLGLLMGWPEIYWLGQQRRMKAVLAPVESMARYLEGHWPLEDGDLPGIGPYLAYPKGDPTTVLPLKWITFPDTTLRFSAIEHAHKGVIRFELAGNEQGAWLEWRSDDRAPAPFLSGLDTAYRVSRQQRLAPRWFLVRYRVGDPSSTL